MWAPMRSSTPPTHRKGESNTQEEMPETNEEEWKTTQSILMWVKYESHKSRVEVTIGFTC